MFQGKTRRFGHRANGRNNMSRNNSQTRPRLNTFSNGQIRNKFRPSLSAEKSLEKYNSLAKEAMTSGDKTLSENYLQHADHFMRIIEDRNRNRNESKVNVINKPVENSKNFSDNSNAKQSEETKDRDKD